MLLHPDPKRVLLVGVGTGQTAARFLLYPIDRLECVDIEPTIFSLSAPISTPVGWKIPESN